MKFTTWSAILSKHEVNLSVCNYHLVACYSVVPVIIITTYPYGLSFWKRINFQIWICGFGFETPDLDLDLIIFKRGGFGFGFELFWKGGFGFEGLTGFGFGFEPCWICPPLLQWCTTRAPKTQTEKRKAMHIVAAHPQ